MTVSNESLPVITRPNGKPYRPRSIRARCWEDEYSGGVVVLGTHDIDLARPLAVEGCRHFHGIQYAIKPEIGWFRDSFYRNDRAWTYDTERGAAGVWFTASDDPEEDR